MTNSSTNKRSVSISLILTVTFLSFFFYAYSTGITGVTQLNGAGCTCHDQNLGVTVTISGPTTLEYNQTGNYTVTISGGPLVRGGTNIAASAGTLIAGTGLRSESGELTHISPKAPASGVVTFNFQYTAPGTTQTVTLYANGNSVNFNGNNEGDGWNFASNLNINVVPIVPVEISSMRSEVSGNSINLFWTSATELNNMGFSVQRAIISNSENLIWNEIAFVNGKGTTTEFNHYSFSDNNLNSGQYKYRLIQKDFDGKETEYLFNEVFDINLPAEFVLGQNYPNPFNPHTIIEYSIAAPTNVSLKVYDVKGSIVSEPVNEMKNPGSYYVNFNASNLASGIYYYTLTAGNFIQTKKMLILK